MIEFGNGNLLDADVQAFVNTVNTGGIMGKGIALQFKKAFLEQRTTVQRTTERTTVSDHFSLES